MEWLVMIGIRVNLMDKKTIKDGVIEEMDGWMDGYMYR